MPELRAFKGIRYSSVEDLEDLVCPPYDIISPAEQELLHERHPHNAVRLELARSAGGAEKYKEVATTFSSWLDAGVLHADEAPSLYVYRQDFAGPEGRPRSVTGVIGALALEPFGTGSGVLPHEQTMPGPKADRLALLRACPINFSPIYAIYRGQGGLAPFFESLEDRPVAAGFRDEHGILHRLWTIAAPTDVATLGAAVRTGPLVIADGHHRYETALAYHDEQRGAPGAHDAIMCFCVDADAAGLVVLPYHRALKTRADVSQVRASLVERFGGRALDGRHAHDAVVESAADHPMVFVFADGDMIVEVSDEDVVGAVGTRHPAWRALDVVALHEVVLPTAVPDGVDGLTFSKDPNEVRDLVGSGWTAGVLLRALDAPSIVDVASSGERMPQKASYFWPKAVTGLVFRPLD